MHAVGVRRQVNENPWQEDEPELVVQRNQRRWFMRDHGNSDSTTLRRARTVLMAAYGHDKLGVERWLAS